MSVIQILFLQSFLMNSSALAAAENPAEPPPIMMKS